jgi:hypothetical protein
LPEILFVKTGKKSGKNIFAAMIYTAPSCSGGFSL